MLRLGYNTSGFARSQDLGQVLGALSEMGYAGVELTLDRRHFHPYFSGDRERARLRHALADHGLDLVLNTGGRHVLSDVPHQPSLVSSTREGREVFFRFAEACIDLAPSLGAEVVMLHSGSTQPWVEPETAWGWLTSQLSALAERAAGCGIMLGFEFHPDMFVASLEDYWRLKQAVPSPALRLTLDIGHVVCTDPRPISRAIGECDGEIVNVHLEDIKGREHVHLPIGKGDIDFAEVFQTLKQVGYRGLVSAEFNSDDLEVDECQLARETYRYLQRLM